MSRSRVSHLRAVVLGGLVLGACAPEPTPAPGSPSAVESPQLDRTAGWSLVRRQLLAAPEGVSAAQVQAVEALLSELRQARRHGAEVDLSEREAELAASIRASDVGRRPSVQAALATVVPPL